MEEFGRFAGKTFLELVIEWESYLVKPFLEADEFVRYCQERGIDINLKLLEKLEETGQFYPLIRIESPEITVKVEHTEDHKGYYIRGELRLDEIWSGETRQDRYPPIWNRQHLEEDAANGRIWEPIDKPFLKWENHRQNGRKFVYTYYSAYQIGHLKRVIDVLIIKLPAVYWAAEDLPSNRQLIKNIDEITKAVLVRNRASIDEATALAQILANRYQPRTRSDGRTMTIPGIISSDRLGWNEVSKNPELDLIVETFSLCEEKSRLIYLGIVSNARAIDPLEKWFDLVSFVAVNRRDQLKGYALLARELYEMAEMLRMLYFDLFGKVLPKPNEGWDLAEKEYYGLESGESILEHLTYVTNRYHLNPKPRLILIVEGSGEYEVIPKLYKDVFGYSLETSGIEIQNLYGIGNFEGKKGVDRFGALEKFIDDHHSRQTYVVVVLDREGRAKQIADKLTAAKSKRVGVRNVTNKDLIFFWDKNIEFDNFTDEQIASALSYVSGNRYTFTLDEVFAARSSFGKKRDPVSDLYKEKLSYNLNKTNLLKLLFSKIDVNCDPGVHPIIDILNRISELSSLNHQPTDRGIKMRNQKSGLFGNIIET